MTQIERAAQIYMQRENFILKAPSNITNDICSEDLVFPGDFAEAASIIAEKLSFVARLWRDQTAEWKRL